MAGKYGYQEIAKVAFLGVALGNSTYEAAHASTGLGRVGAFLSAADEALALLTLDRAELKAEWDDMDDDDWSRLVAECRERFALPNEPGLEARIERAVGAGFKALEAIVEAVAAMKGDAA